MLPSTPSLRAARNESAWEHYTNSLPGISGIPASVPWAGSPVRSPPLPGLPGGHGAPLHSSAQTGLQLAPLKLFPLWAANQKQIYSLSVKTVKRGKTWLAGERVEPNTQRRASAQSEGAPAHVRCCLVLCVCWRTLHPCLSCCLSQGQQGEDGSIAEHCS